ncbi:MAG: ABC transporter permease [Bdellovibrio sp.]|nr:MAG: ABC transporter permease [Bdellovibrio sp.]
MRPIIAIFRKEFKGFLFNPNFLLVCALMATLLSFLYPISLRSFQDQARNAMMFAHNSGGQQLNIHYGVFLKHLSYLNLMLILVVPALTMRLFAEEKKMKTFDLLLTSPITSAQIVIGKYLAALAAIFVIMLLAFLYPLSTAYFAKINWGPLVVAFLGIFLVAAVYAAMSLFCSSLTESAIVAFAMAVLFNISIWFVGVGVEVVDSSTARSVFEHISLNQHLTAMVEGTVRSSTLIFFGSAIFLFGFLSERVIESSRWR